MIDWYGCIGRILDRIIRGQSQRAIHNLPSELLSQSAPNVDVVVNKACIMKCIMKETKIKLLMDLDGATTLYLITNSVICCSKS